MPFAVGGQKTKKPTITIALEESIARRAQPGTVEHVGKLAWDEEYDYQQARHNRERKLGWIADG